MPKQIMLAEAAKIAPDTLSGNVWRIKGIEGDRQGSSAFYPKEALESGAHLFAKGTRIYMNHPTADEKWSRPERSVEDIIGVFESEAEYDGGDLYANARFFSTHRDFIKERAEAGVIGMSIRANGDVEETADGPVVKAFTSVASVDVVTTAGAGGGFESLLEAARKTPVSESGAESEKKEESEMDKELAKALDALVESSKATADAVAQLTKRAEDEDAAKAAALAEAERKAAEDKAPKLADIVAALDEAELPKTARTAVITQVEAGVPLKEAIDAKVAEVKALLEESGTGFTGNVSGGGSSEKSLEESIAANITKAFG